MSFITEIAGLTRQVFTTAVGKTPQQLGEYSSLSGASVSCSSYVVFGANKDIIISTLINDGEYVGSEEGIVGGKILGSKVVPFLSGENDFRELMSDRVASTSNRRATLAFEVTVTNNNAQLSEESGNLIEDFWHGFRSDIVAGGTTYYVLSCDLTARVRSVRPEDRT